MGISYISSRDKDRCMRANTLARKRNQAYVSQDKERGCQQCGETHPRCLDYHHRDRATKHLAISVLKSRSYSLEILKAEIEKCDLLCANCHRKLEDSLEKP
jgi:hypothetical protein